MMDDGIDIQHFSCMLFCQKPVSADAHCSPSAARVTSMLWKWMRNYKIKTLITEFISGKIAPIDDLTEHPSWAWFLCVARSADKGQRERWIMHHCLLYTTVNWPRMMDGHVLCLFLPWLCSGDWFSFFSCTKCTCFFICTSSNAPRCSCWT